MANLQPSKVLKQLDGDRDWNDSDEGESGSDDDNAEDAGEIDYLTEAQVICSSFYWETKVL